MELLREYELLIEVRKTMPPQAFRPPIYSTENNGIVPPIARSTPPIYATVRPNPFMRPRGIVVREGFARDLIVEPLPSIPLPKILTGSEILSMQLEEKDTPMRHSFTKFDCITAVLFIIGIISGLIYIAGKVYTY